MCITHSNYSNCCLTVQYSRESETIWSGRCPILSPGSILTFSGWLSLRNLVYCAYIAQAPSKKFSRFYPKSHLFVVSYSILTRAQPQELCLTNSLIFLILSFSYIQWKWSKHPSEFLSSGSVSLNFSRVPFFQLLPLCTLHYLANTAHTAELSRSQKHLQGLILASSFRFASTNSFRSSPENASLPFGHVGICLKTTSLFWCFSGTLRHSDWFCPWSPQRAANQTSNQRLWVIACLVYEDYNL